MGKEAKVVPVERCAALAERLAKVDAEARQALKPLLRTNGQRPGVTAGSATRMVRRQVKRLYGQGTDPERIPVDLRNALLQFIVEAGITTRGDGPVSEVRVQVWMTREDRELIERAAKRHKMSVGGFMRVAAIRQGRAILDE